MYNTEAVTAGRQQAGIVSSFPGKKKRERESAQPGNLHLKIQRSGDENEPEAFGTDVFKSLVRQCRMAGSLRGVTPATAVGETISPLN